MRADGQQRVASPVSPARGRLVSQAKADHTQLSRVFVDAYGKTPLTYLTMLRVEEMARLLRETDLAIAEAGRRVGWRSRNHASAAFGE
ncbi:helix-turn-helix domain-containing protein [Brachybacterium tyrofermentans]|uniref:helix-turn-helix domain-containing protein n=1 Tax=Brachybacterium tyrofermentans TaxID=47848 RepID=UPI003FD29FE5